MKKEKKVRYILQLEDVELGRGSSIHDIARILGCSHQYIYRVIQDGKLVYNKKVYTIIDRLA